MTEREEMIGLLREAYEELERTGEDRCECDESVDLMCYFCRLRQMLHKLIPNWTCAYEEEYRNEDKHWGHDPSGGFWGDEHYYLKENVRPAWMPDSAQPTDEEIAASRARTDELLEAHPELRQPIARKD